MLKTHVTTSKSVANFHDGFGACGVCLVLKIALRRSDYV